MSPDPGRRTFAPVLLGIALTCAFLLLIGYAARKRRAMESQPLPRLTIIAPARGDVVDSPLVVRFTSPRPLVLQPSGWGYQKFHLHVWINGVQHMPAGADIRQVDGETYDWMLASVRNGRATVYLGWADQAHRERRQSSSDTISFSIH
jgi:hypothetical protein